MGVSRVATHKGGVEGSRGWGTKTLQISTKEVTSTEVSRIVKDLVSPVTHPLSTKLTGRNPWSLVYNNDQSIPGKSASGPSPRRGVKSLSQGPVEVGTAWNTEGTGPPGE